MIQLHNQTILINVLLNIGNLIMAKFLIHIHSGPELKNKATLGMLVAITALNKGNEVNLFLAADGTHLLNIKNEGELLVKEQGI